MGSNNQWWLKLVFQIIKHLFTMELRYLLKINGTTFTAFDKIARSAIKHLE